MNVVGDEHDHDEHGHETERRTCLRKLSDASRRCMCDVNPMENAALMGLRACTVENCAMECDMG